MKPYLLDINVLIALAWPNHVHHDETVEWFERNAAASFRTCPITQTGFVRISSNPSFSSSAVSPADALSALATLVSQPGHAFWPDDLELAAAFGKNTLVATHRQITDGYLLALATAHDGVLATLDRGIRGLARRSPERVEIILSTTSC